MLVSRKVRGLENSAEDTSGKERGTEDMPPLAKGLLRGNLKETLRTEVPGLWTRDSI